MLDIVALVDGVRLEYCKLEFEGKSARKINFILQIRISGSDREGAGLADGMVEAGRKMLLVFISLSQESVLLKIYVFLE